METSLSILQRLSMVCVGRGCLEGGVRREAPSLQGYIPSPQVVHLDSS